MLLSSLLYFRGKERGEENKRKRNGNERAIGSRVIQVSQTHRAFLFRFHLALIGGGIFSRSSSHLVDGNIITSASPAGLHLSTTLSSMFDLWRCMDQLCRVGKRHCTALKSVKIRSSSYISSTIQEHQILQLFFLKRMITYMLHNPIKYPSVYQILKSKSVSSTGGPQVHHKDLTSVEGNLCGMTRPPCNGPASMCVYIGPSRRLDYEECIPYCVIFWHVGLLMKWISLWHYDLHISECIHLCYHAITSEINPHWSVHSIVDDNAWYLWAVYEQRSSAKPSSPSFCHRWWRYFRRARDPKLLRLASSQSTLPCLPANKRTPFFPALQTHSHSSSSRCSNFPGFLFYLSSWSHRLGLQTSIRLAFEVTRK